MNHWFRFYSEFASDPKVQSMPEAMQRRLVMLFCLRCSDVLVTFQEQDIAFALRVTEQELAVTKELFTRKGFIDDTWRLCNWDKRQYVSDSSTERTRAYRERLRTSQKRHSDGVDTEQIQNRTDSEQKIKSKTPARTAPPKGSRLHMTEPTEEMNRFALEEMHWSVERLAEVWVQFADYWKAKAGRDGCKLDWVATWRNWCRNQRAPTKANGSLFPIQRESKTDEALRIMTERAARAISKGIAQ